MRVRKKQKYVYYAIDQMLVRRNNLIKFSIASVNVIAFIIFALASAFINTDTPALAAAYTWDGGGVTNNWSDCDNWSANICPLASDTITFNNISVKDSVVDIAFSGEVAGLTIADGYTGTISLDRSLTSTGVFTQASGSTFTAGSNTLSIALAFTISPGATFNAGTGTIIFAGSGATLNCSNTVFNHVEFQHTTGTKTINSGCNLPLGTNPTITGQITMNGGLLTGDGTLTTNATLTLSNSDVPSGFTHLIISSNSLVVSGSSNADFSNYTTIEISFSLTIGGSSNFVAPSGEIILSGAFIHNSSGNYNANGGTIRFIGGSSTLDCGTATFSHAEIAHNAGTKTVSANCTLPLGADPTISGTVTLNGTLTGSGTLSASSGTLTINNTGVLTGFTGIVANALTVNGSLNLSTHNPVDFNSNLTLINGSTFTAPSGEMFVAGNFTINVGATFNHNNGSVVFDGAGSTITCNNASFNHVQFQHTSGTKTISNNCYLPLGVDPTIPNAITVNGILAGIGTLSRTAGTTAINSTGSITGFSAIENNGGLTLNGPTLDWSNIDSLIAGNFTANSGTNFTAPSESDFNSNLTLINGSTFTAPSGEMFVAGNFTINVGATFNHNNGSVVFDGAGSTITCNNASFNHVQFQHISGNKVVSEGCNLPLGHDPTIRGTTLSGILTGSGALTQDAGNTTINATGELIGFSSLELNTITLNGPTIDWSGLDFLIVNGALTVNAGADLKVPSVISINNQLRLNPGSIFTASQDEMTVNNLIIEPGATFYHNNGILTFTGPFNITIVCSGATFNLVQFRKSGTSTQTVSSDCSLPLGHNPTLGDGVNPGNLHLYGTFTGSGTLHSALNSLNIRTGGQLVGFTGYTGSTFRVIDASVDFNDFSIFNTDRTVELSTNATFIAPSDMTLGSLMVDNSSTFTHNNGTVTLTGLAGVPGLSRINGDITFYNLNTHSSVNSVEFASGTTTTVQNSLVMQGQDEENLISLVSSIPESEWYIDALGDRTLQYLSVQDSFNINSEAMLAYDSQDLGNNTNWQFLASPTPEPPVNPDTPSDSVDVEGSNSENALANTGLNIIVLAMVGTIIFSLGLYVQRRTS